MEAVNKKTIVLLICLLSTSVLTGCTNWKKKYEALNVEHQNVKGLLDRERSDKRQLADQVAQGQMTIEELQRKIAEAESTAEATGFGKGYDVAFDASAGTITVTLQNSILFDSGKADLKNKTQTELNHIYSVLSSQYAGKLIDVVGHTDSDPIKKSKWSDNWELSAERALSVVRYMISKGISEDRIRAVGRGASVPVAPNTTVSGKSQNRRVEIVVYVKG